MKEISEQNIKNTGQCIPLGYVLSLFVQEKYIYCPHPFSHSLLQIFPYLNFARFPSLGLVT